MILFILCSDVNLTILYFILKKRLDDGLARSFPGFTINDIAILQNSDVNTSKTGTLSLTFLQIFQPTISNWFSNLLPVSN